MADLGVHQATRFQQEVVKRDREDIDTDTREPPSQRGCSRSSHPLSRESREHRASRPERMAREIQETRACNPAEQERSLYLLLSRLEAGAHQQSIRTISREKEGRLIA